LSQKTPNQIKYAKRLRSQIVLTAKAQGMDTEILHDVMFQWGFGVSLRKLDVNQLVSLYKVLEGEESPKFSKEAELDKQGKFIYSLMKQIGWDMTRLEQLLLKKFKKTHINVLNESEKKMVIAILKSYLKSDGETQQ